MTTDPAGAAKAVHPWSAEALLVKAQRYAEEMLANTHEDWRFGLASTFVLEFLARAALGRVSPTLLADSKNSQDWANLYFALGHTPKQERFLPKSIAVSEVFVRLGKVLPDFTEELVKFAIEHIGHRNEELHSGTAAFDGLRAGWLARFYEVCTVLMASLGEPLEALVGEKESRFAATVIQAARDTSAKAVLKAIAEHKGDWAASSEADRTKAVAQASIWATRQAGHRVACPACGSDALLTGTPFSEPVRRLDGDLIVETQEYLPSKFECVACRLKISGLSQLTACDLGSAYKRTLTYDAADYYAPQDLRFSLDDELPGFDDDNNEY